MSLHDFWVLVSELGNSKWLLPAACLLVLASGPHRWQLGWRWLSGLAVASLVVLVSKLAFMGWGIGSRAWDFTGFSGHAAISAAIYPVALGLLVGFRWRIWGALAGVALALLISYSRLPLHAHSVSEVVLGSLVGLSASAWFYLGPPQVARPTLLAWVGAVALAWAASFTVLPGVGTHDLVMKMAQAASGREVLYTRKWLRQQG
ncbi:phosphatase PAP2 family protein [Comamonadaceae bacterium PP-2]